MWDGKKGLATQPESLEKHCSSSGGYNHSNIHDPCMPAIVQSAWVVGVCTIADKAAVLFYVLRGGVVPLLQPTLLFPRPQGSTEEE